MKTFAPLFFIILYVQIGFSQDIDSCRAVVVQTVKAINAEAETAIESHLAADFEMAGHKGEIAKLVASQLIFQLGDTIESYEEASQKFEENNFKLFFNRYFSLIEWNELEKNNFNFYLKASAIRFFMTRLHDKYFNTSGEVDHKDPLAFFEIINFHRKNNLQDFF